MWDNAFQTLPHLQIFFSVAVAEVRTTAGSRWPAGAMGDAVLYLRAPVIARRRCRAATSPSRLTGKTRVYTRKKAACRLVMQLIWDAFGKRVVTVEGRTIGE